MTGARRIVDCRSCKAAIFWAETETGKRIPIDASTGPDVDANLVIEDGDGGPLARYVARGEGTHITHFTTCPDAKRWRR